MDDRRNDIDQNSFSAADAAHRIKENELHETTTALSNKGFEVGVQPLGAQFLIALRGVPNRLKARHQHALVYSL